MNVTCCFFCKIFQFLCNRCVLDENNDGYAIMTVELITIVDLFLMSLPIMQAIIPIKSYPTEPALEQASTVKVLLSPAA